jgi:rhodanese-related sulfurtransferase
MKRRSVFLLLLCALLAGCSLFRRGGERPAYRKLTPPVAYELIRDNPELLILDLRAPEEFLGDTGHLRRARNIPLDRLPFRLLELAAFREDTFLVYCDAGDCGERAMDVLVSSGFENAILMEGGIDSWIREGFRTVLPRHALGRPGAVGGAVRPLRPDEMDGTRPEDVPTTPPPD